MYKKDDYATVLSQSKIALSNRQTGLSLSSSHSQYTVLEELRKPGSRYGWLVDEYQNKRSPRSATIKYGSPAPAPRGRAVRCETKQCVSSQPTKRCVPSSNSDWMFNPHEAGILGT